MKKVFALISVVIFLYSFFGYYFVSEIRQCMIREEVKEMILGSLPESQLILIRSVAGGHDCIQWIEKGREFRFRGMMYDVVKSKVVSGTTYYYCYNDTKESSLLAGISKMTREQSDHSKSKINKKPVITYFFQEPPVPALTFTDCYIILIPIAACKSGFSENLSPPPELSFS